MEDHHMHKLAFIAGALAILSTPALAASAAGDKPMVVAEESGVSVSVGDTDHDKDHHRRIVVIHHDKDKDRDHHRRIVVTHSDRDHGDHDHGDHDHDQH